MIVENLNLNEVLSCTFNGAKYHEEWRPVKNYNGIYEVSSFGRVKSLERIIKNGKKSCFLSRPKIMKQTIGSKGYYGINLRNKIRKQKSVHQLVAESFHNHTPCGYRFVINHKDFDRSNNFYKNLEIITQRQNTNKKHLKSTSKYVGVSWDKSRSKWVSLIRIEKKHKHLGLFNCELSAAIAYQQELKKLYL